MDQPEPDTESPFRDVLRRGRELTVPGFTERAVAAVRRDARRRRTLRWVALASPIAAALLLYVGVPAASGELSEQDLAQVASLHDSVAVELPRLDDTAALAALVIADFEESIVMPRLEGAEETIAALVLADS